MRDTWNRSAPLLTLGMSDLTILIQPAFPGQSVVEAAVTEGGLANTNIRVRLSHTDQSVLVRLYVRSPRDGRKEYMLHQRIASSVRVPRYMYFSEHNPITEHPYGLMEWIAGERLEVIAPRVSADQLAGLGQSVGATLAAIHALTFPQTGFLTPALDIAQPIAVGSDALLAYLQMTMLDGWGSERLGSELTHAMMAYVTSKGTLLDTWDGPPCLVHGDYGGSNILVRARGDEWEVAAVVDWEFVFSGSPFFDLGNLLRPPLGHMGGFEQAVYTGYISAGGRLPERWRMMSRLIDLLSLADFLNRPHTNAAFIEDARAMIIETLAH